MQSASPLSKKLSNFIAMNDAERGCLASLLAAPVKIRRGSELIRQGEAGQFACFVQSGWGCSFKLLQDGSRQIITFPIAGDCIGLRSLLLRVSDHSFSALTDVYVSRIEVARILPIFVEYPRLGSALLWATSRDEAITVDHLASIGRRTALERTAHFFLELSERLRMVGLTQDCDFMCPLTQYDLADALGLSAIHVNRVLRELREINLLTFQDGQVTFHDMATLKSLAGYEAVDSSALQMGSDGDEPPVRLT
jgi:CRP-like cAMP-binding protein